MKRRSESRERAERERIDMRMAHSSRSSRVAVLLGAALALLSASCKQQASMAPMAVHMREIDKTWALFSKTIDEKGPYHAQPYVAQLAGMFRSDVIASSDYYRNPEFKRHNDDMVKALDRFDTELSERALFDVMSSRQDIQNLCKNCHNQFWEKAKKRRESR